MHVTPELLRQKFCAMCIHSGTIYLYLQTHPEHFTLYTIRPESNIIINASEPDGAFISSVSDITQYLNKLLIKNGGKRVRLYTAEEFIEYFGAWMPF